MATVEPLLGVMIDDKKQKSTITNNFTKGGVDIIDKKIEFYSAKTKSIWWTIVSMAHLLVTIRVNASTVYAMNNGLEPKKRNSFHFKFHLVELLFTPQIISDQVVDWLQLFWRKFCFLCRRKRYLETVTYFITQKQ